MIVFESIDRTSGTAANCELTLTRGFVPNKILLKNYIISAQGDIPWVWDGVNHLKVRRNDNGEFFDVIILELSTVDPIIVETALDAAFIAAGITTIGSGVDADGNYFVDFPFAYDALWSQSTANNIFNTQDDVLGVTTITFNSHYIKVPDQLYVSMPYATPPEIGTPGSSSTLTISLVDKLVNQIVFLPLITTVRFTWYRYSDSAVPLPMTKEWTLIFEPL